MKKTRKLLISMFTFGLILRNAVYATSGSDTSSDGFPIKYIFMGVAFLVIVLLLFLGYKMDTRSTDTYVAPKKSKKSVNPGPESTSSAPSINTMNNLNNEDDIVFPNKVYVDENEESLFATSEEEDYQGFTTAESLKESQKLDEELNGTTNPPVDNTEADNFNDVIVEDEAIDKDNTEELDNTLIMNNVYDDDSLNNVNDVEPISDTVNTVEDANPDLFSTAATDDNIESGIDFSAEPVEDTIPEPDPSITVDSALNPDVDLAEMPNEEPAIELNDEPEEEPAIEYEDEPEETITEPAENIVDDNEEYGEDFDTSIIDNLDEEEDNPAVVSTILDTSEPVSRKAEDTMMFNTDSISSLSGKSLNDEIEELDDLDNNPAGLEEESLNDVPSVEIPEEIEEPVVEMPEEPEEEPEIEFEDEPEEYYDDTEESNDVEEIDNNVVPEEEVTEDIPEDIVEDDDDYYEEEEPVEKEVEVEEEPDDVAIEEPTEDNPDIEYTDPVDIDFGILDEDDTSTTSKVDSFADDLKKFDEPADDFAGFTVAAKEEPVEPKIKPKRFTRMMPKEFTTNKETNKETSVSDEDITDDDIEDNDFYENDFLKQMEENFKNNNEFDDEDDDNKF